MTRAASLTRTGSRSSPSSDEPGRVAGLVTLRDLVVAERFPRATRDELGRVRVAAAVGIRGDRLERASKLIDAGVDALIVDIAHGHFDGAIEACGVSKFVSRLQKSAVSRADASFCTPQALDDVLVARANWPTPERYQVRCSSTVGVAVSSTGLSRSLPATFRRRCSPTGS
jgi:IMP dehydrogenase / GMP reductase domain